MSTVTRQDILAAPSIATKLAMGYLIEKEAESLSDKLERAINQDKDYRKFVKQYGDYYTNGDPIDFWLQKYAINKFVVIGKWSRTFPRNFVKVDTEVLLY